MYTRVFHAVVVGLIAGALSTPLANESGTEPLFDLSDISTSPFPTDWLTVADDEQLSGRQVRLPKPEICGADPTLSDCKDVDTINTLDGFNIQPRVSIPFSGPIDPTTITSGTVFFVSLGDAVTGAGAGKRIGIDQVVWDPETHTVHVESEALLDQHTRYALIVTRAVRDVWGAPIGVSDAFEQFPREFNFGQTEDPELKAYRKALLDALAHAAMAGVQRRNVAVASVFTTQSVTAVLEKIRDQITAATPVAPDFRLAGPDAEPTVFAVSSMQSMIFDRQVTEEGPFSRNDLTNAQLRAVKANANFPGAVERIAFGRYASPNYLTACVLKPCDPFIPPTPTRTGVPRVQGTEDVFFNVFLPKGDMPAGGWPVVIYGFGSGGNKDASPYFFVAPAMAAAGLAVVAINGVGQGFGPRSELTISVDRDGDRVIDRVAKFLTGHRSYDRNGDGLIGSAVPVMNEGNQALPQGDHISRVDVLRQTVVDVMQLVRVIHRGIDIDEDGAPDLDGSRIYYFGFSHGGDHGTLLLAVDPLVQAAVLNAGGGDNVDLYRLGAGLRPSLGRYLAQRKPSLLNAPAIVKLDHVDVAAPRFNENLPLRDGLGLKVHLDGDIEHEITSPVINTVAGALDIQRVVDRTEWVLQAISPIAYAPYLRKTPLDGVPAKAVIMQFAKGDRTVANPLMTAVIRAGDLADRTTFFRNDLAFAVRTPSTMTKESHDFATRSSTTTIADQVAVVLAAQRQIAQFFVSDGMEVIDPDGAGSFGTAAFPGAPPGLLFEVPIAGPLPESLNFIP